MREGRISYGFSRVALSKYPGSLFGRYPMMPEKPADTETAGGRDLACLLCALTAQGKSRMIGNRNTVEKCRRPWSPHGLRLLTQPVHTFHAKRRPVQKPHPLSSFCPVHAAGRGPERAVFCAAFRGFPCLPVNFAYTILIKQSCIIFCNSSITI